jgi:hypothetical protein
MGTSCLGEWARGLLAAAPIEAARLAAAAFGGLRGGVFGAALRTVDRGCSGTVGAAGSAFSACLANHCRCVFPIGGAMATAAGAAGAPSGTAWAVEAAPSGTGPDEDARERGGVPFGTAFLLPRVP